MTAEFSRYLAMVMHTPGFTRDLTYEQQREVVAECEQYETLAEVPKALRDKLERWAQSAPARS